LVWPDFGQNTRPAFHASLRGSLWTGHLFETRQQHAHSTRPQHAHLHTYTTHLSLHPLTVSDPYCRRSIHKAIIASSSPMSEPHPAFTMAHTPKARSIGSLPHQLRLTPCEPGPQPIRSPSVASPPGSRSGMMSPSRLPAADCMSYFPPFECMGSGPSSPTPEAGPLTRSNSTSEVERGHTKGRSLGSLAGLMTLLSPASSPLRTSISSAPYSAPAVHRSISDGDVLLALTKRVTPGKRRVLEPITLSNDVLPEAMRYRRRRTSSADIVSRRNTSGVEETAIEASVSIMGHQRAEFNGHALTARPRHMFDAAPSPTSLCQSRPSRSGASRSPRRPSHRYHRTSRYRHSHPSTTPLQIPRPLNHPPPSLSRHHRYRANTSKTTTQTRDCRPPHRTTAPSRPGLVAPQHHTATRVRRNGITRRIAYAPSTTRRSSTLA